MKTILGEIRASRRRHKKWIADQKKLKSDLAWLDARTKGQEELAKREEHYRTKECPFVEGVCKLYGCVFWRGRVSVLPRLFSHDEEEWFPFVECHCRLER